MPVDVCELPGSPVIRYSGSGGVFAAERRLKVAWTDIDAFVAELLPISTTTGSQVSQVLGAEFPYITGLYVDDFEIAPFYANKDRITNSVVPVEYADALFTVKYSAPPFFAEGGTFPQPVETDPVTFLEHKTTSGGQLLSLEASAGYWKYIHRSTVDTDPSPTAEEYLEIVHASVPEGTSLPVLVTTSQHSVHWPRVPRPNWPNLNNYKGHVNESVFYLGGYPYQPETLMYLNYDREDKVMSNRFPVHDLTLHFEGKEVRNPDPTINDENGVPIRVDELGGHNHYWNKAVGAWMKVATGVSGGVATKSPFPKADFNLLFQAG